MTASTRRRKATVVGGVAVATLIGALFVVSTRDDSAATAPPAGEKITVTPDSIEFGEGLQGFVGRVVKENGRLYVLPGKLDEEQKAQVKKNLSPYLTESTKTAVLAAFDDGGVERWRTTLDGMPEYVAIADGDPWVSHGDGTVTRIDSSDGRILDHFTIEYAGTQPLMGAFGSVWASQARPPRLVRIDPDLSTIDIELGPDDWIFDTSPSAAAGAIWIPLGDRGVAMIDPDTNEMTVIPVDDIGHPVWGVAVDGDVVYVASRNQVTSIVDGEVRATVSPGEIRYLGQIDGVFGALLPGGRFEALHANEPMLGELRWISLEGMTGPGGEIDGEAWMAVGRNYSLRRIELLPVSAGD